MFTLRTGDAGDTHRIVDLINSAYSGDGGRAGWTHEAHLIEGERTDAAEIAGLIAAPEGRFLLCFDGAALVGCAYVRTMGGPGYLGMLAVRPALQGGGVGKLLLAEGERIIHEEWGCASALISVFTSHRPELSAFYERRGYVRTGRTKPLLRDAQDVKVEGLGLEWMEKRFAAT